MKIGILLTGHPPAEIAGEERYDAHFKRLLGDRDFTYATWSVVDGEMPPAPDAAEGWLITGSRHGAYEPHPWIAPLEQFIRDCYAAHIPMIGVCFGHQVIAQAMGGKVEKFKAGWSIGQVEYQINDKPVVINAWHQDQVVEVPKSAKIIGSSAFCKNAALLYDDRMLTIQPHPEYDDDFIKGLIKYRGTGVVPDTQLAEASAKMGQPLGRFDFARQMTEFFKKERA